MAWRRPRAPARLARPTFDVALGAGRCVTRPGDRVDLALDVPVPKAADGSARLDGRAARLRRRRRPIPTWRSGAATARWSLRAQPQRAADATSGRRLRGCPARGGLQRPRRRAGSQTLTVRGRPARTSGRRRPRLARRPRRSGAIRRRPTRTISPGAGRAATRSRRAVRLSAALDGPAGGRPAAPRGSGRPRADGRRRPERPRG